MTVDIDVYRKFVGRSQSKVPFTLILSSAGRGGEGAYCQKTKRVCINRMQ